MSNQIELRHYRYFLAVAEELHFRKAAERLYISQPGLSRQIRQMEKKLNIQLFERNNKKVQLTVAGIYLRDETRLVLKHLEKITEHAKMLNRGMEGMVEIGYVGSAMQNVIPELLIKFKKEHPNIQFGLKELDNFQQIDQLLLEKIDVGFVRLNEVPPELNIREVYKETFSVVLPEDHPMDAAHFKSLAQLKDETFVFFEKSYSPIYYSRVMSIFEESGFSPKVSHTTVHANTIFRLVENNFGISIVPTSLKLGYNLKVKFIELKEIPQKAILFMSWKKNNRNPILDKLLEIV